MRVAHLRRQVQLPDAIRCNTNAYMPGAKVMTLRIDPGLFAELREVAMAEHRSVSAHVLSLVRRDLQEKPARCRETPLPTFGWLRHLDAPDRLEEYRRVRRALSRRLAMRTRRVAVGHACSV
jgi:hypothetical protein